jgi:P-type E1-E2 ATPase
MYDKTRDIQAKASNCTLMEELGQIHYLFSDKTGTLTKNEMTVKAFQIGVHLYGNIHQISQPVFQPLLDHFKQDSPLQFKLDRNVEHSIKSQN